MIISEFVEMKWNAKNKNRYVSFGYTFTKMKESFMVKVYDLPKHSKVHILCQCDYCGKQYYTDIRTIIDGRKVVNKDCCSNPQCTGKKAADVLMEKYGVSNPLQIEAVKEKERKTNLERYGVENVLASEEVKEKIRNFYMENYGVSNNMQLQSTVEKSKETCMKKYGVPNYSQTQEFKDSMTGENSPVWKGGITQERYERANSEYRKLRRVIFERDHFTCQICGISGGVEINAHHIFNWRDNESKRYDVNNGICMCQQCHMLFHSIYGKKNNTPEQLDDFIELWKKDMLNYHEQ